jgi:hypothetical protein
VYISYGSHGNRVCVEENMSRDNWMRVVLAMAAILIIVGISIMVCSWLWGNRNVIVVKLNGDNPQMVGFECLGLVPGDEREYTVSLKSRMAGEGIVRLQFVEREEKTLKQYAYVKIFLGETLICDELMANVFKREQIELIVDFTSGDSTDLHIVYYLPVDVGNEAKNADVSFDLILSAGDK